MLCVLLAHFSSGELVKQHGDFSFIVQEKEAVCKEAMRAFALGRMSSVCAFNR